MSINLMDKEKIMNTNKVNPKISTGRVDINVLTTRVKREQQRKKINFIFKSLLVALVVVFGIYLLL